MEVAGRGGRHVVTYSEENSAVAKQSVGKVYQCTLPFTANLMYF